MPELSEADIVHLQRLIRETSLETVLLAVGKACERWADAYSGSIYDDWITRRDIAFDAADLARTEGL